MASFTFVVVGDLKVSKNFRDMSKEITKNMRQPLTTASDKYLNVISTNFKDMGATFGNPWPPLSKATIAEKRKLYAKGQSIAVQRPLVRTGQMKKSFEYVVGTNQANIQNTSGYSKIHNEGGYAMFHGRRVKIPRRLLAKVDFKRLQMVRGVFEYWIYSIVRKHTK